MRRISRTRASARPRARALALGGDDRRPPAESAARAEDLVAARLAARRLGDRRAQRPHPLRRARHRRPRRPHARLRRGQGRPRAAPTSAPSARCSRSARASSAGVRRARHRLDGRAPRRARATPRSASTPSASPSTARAEPSTSSTSASAVLAGRARAGCRRPTGTSGGAAARSRSARSPRGARGSSSRRARRSPSPGARAAAPCM